ncbi:MAG: histidine kinase [Oceanospirillaceae bacterium]|mgnify:FL=1|uniref:HDOD domain-containing protein n=1 Tax=unclassified Thalassolituus TaxID=2624967 RepID=UPI000C6AD040|nr:MULTISPECIES: HDOD domain-containing protein [unclassified Thalassolituus]MAS25369.1 histidine kinase [Oceanospirillaceae bacterium]MAY00487.1 histidine kinase [Oceanospirillaceae bacterium]MBS52647.1 histidine kinase [Oceanospirillaceae bacterium]
MAIPASVMKVLDDWKIRYSVPDDEDMFRLMQSNPPASYSARVANVIFLKDDHGKVQVVIPGNRILDLNQLAHQLGRQFTALSADELTRLKNKHGLSEFPALPQVTQIDSLIDSNLLNEKELFIVTGEDNTWIKIPTEQFRHLISSSRTGNYTAPLLTDVHYNDEQQDLEDVNAAIRQFTPLRIQQRLAETLDLPPLPETARRIIELRVDPNADTQSLAEVVELDPAMSAQVVSWARSPYYGVRGEIKNVEDAVLRVLGFDLVINLALGLSLGRTLSVPKEGPHGYAPFWQQSVVTATLCSELVRLMPARYRPSQGLAYLCGLLHNFGFLILGHVFPPQFSLVNRHIEANPHINRFYIERHLLGMTREQISACLLQQWKMPEELVTATRQQHNPEFEGEHSEFSRLLYVAGRSLRSNGFGDGAREKPELYVLDSLGLTQESVDEVTQNILSRLDDLGELVQMLKGK